MGRCSGTGEKKTLLGAEFVAGVDRFGENIRAHVLCVGLRELQNAFFLPETQYGEASSLKALLPGYPFHLNSVGHGGGVDLQGCGVDAGHT